MKKVLHRKIRSRKKIQSFSPFLLSLFNPTSNVHKVILGLVVTLTFGALLIIFLHNPFLKAGAVCTPNVNGCNILLNGSFETNYVTDGTWITANGSGSVARLSSTQLLAQEPQPTDGSFLVSASTVALTSWWNEYIRQNNIPIQANIPYLLSFDALGGTLSGNNDLTTETYYTTTSQSPGAYFHPVVQYPSTNTDRHFSNMHHFIYPFISPVNGTAQTNMYLARYTSSYYLDNFNLTKLSDYTGNLLQRGRGETIAGFEDGIAPWQLWIVPGAPTTDVNGYIGKSEESPEQIQRAHTGLESITLVQTTPINANYVPGNLGIYQDNMVAMPNSTYGFSFWVYTQVTRNIDIDFIGPTKSDGTWDIYGHAQCVMDASTLVRWSLCSGGFTTPANLPPTTNAKFIIGGFEDQTQITPHNFVYFDDVDLHQNGIAAPTPTPTLPPNPTPTPPPTQSCSSHNGVCTTNGAACNSGATTISYYTCGTGTSCCAPIYSGPTNVLGYLDPTAGQNACTLGITGWACVPGDDRTVAVDLYMNAPYPNGTFITRQYADISSSDQAAIAQYCGGNGTTPRRFNFSVPAAYRDNASHLFYVHGIGGSNVVLNNSGQSFACPTCGLHCPN